MNGVFVDNQETGCRMQITPVRAAAGDTEQLNMGDGIEINLIQY